MLRLAFSALEYLAWWEGRFSARALAELLGLSREHVQRTIVLSYRERAPGRLPPGARPASSMDLEGPGPVWMPGDPGGLVAALSGIKAVCSGSADPWPLSGAFESVPLACRAHGDHLPFAVLYRAMCAKSVVIVEYLAKPGRRSYQFSPHALVDTGDRPHFRGWAEEPGKEGGFFMDLLPARTVEAQLISENGVSADRDDAWHARVDVTMQIRDDLADSLWDAIRAEYATDATGRLTIHDVRLACERYVRRALEQRRVEGRSEPIFRYLDTTPSAHSSNRVGKTHD